MPLATSPRKRKLFSRIPALSVGTGRMYTVSSKLVYALRSAPKRTPIPSRYFTMSFFANDVVPLKAMCSTKWASPRWSSSSRMEPAFTTSRSSARFSGLAFLRM